MPLDFRPFRNSNLFSNHYLEKLIKDNAEWREARPEQAFAAIRDLYQKKGRVIENYNESQLEENFIRPVLRFLDHHFGVQGKVAGKDRTPDYAFFPDQASLDEAEARPKEEYYRRAVAVGDAKSWKVSLDKSRKGLGLFEMQNPSFQIDVYLRDTPPKWAILTNGRLWRLYHETTSYKLDSFYEVDLQALLEAGDFESFKYFYLFFRREAFGQTVDGGSFLDSVREGSVAYSQEIGEDLKENVYRAMKILAQGFLAEVRAAARPDSIPTDAVVRLVQENSMRLLYRLLFIFYAESRGLLDIDNRYYYELSLHKLKVDVAERLDRGEPLLSIRYSYGESLKNLFRLINDGSESHRISREEFYIPAYDGGLFNPAKNQFLEQARIGDSFMAQAIDLLARSGKDVKEKGFVDYSSLEIRHLGSIYEGLLEYRLRVADQEMAAVKEKGREFWLPLGEVGKRKVLDRAAAGEIYLATDKGERKATGSYYTPDYIVKYIVKNTIEPVIERKKQEWLGTGRPFADYLLSIKVLDPAMGSGHFLVEATDQLARWLVSAWETARPEEEKQKEVAEQDIHWARREVVRNCIYGVDLNPMAVELAKLSLWLTTVASNKPLSFLDHHLRCGNSLIGAELEKLTVLPGGQAELTPLWGYVLKSHTDGLLKRYSLMAALPDDNLQMVKWKEEQFRQIKESELSRRLAELADVWLSTYFGNNVNDDDYYELQNHLSPEKFPDWAGLREQEWFTWAAALASEKRFFHWELEFPEAFQGEKPGFDVVVGNPPYVRQERLSGDKRYLEIYKSYHSIADLYVYFIERGVLLLNPSGIFSYIVANKWMRAGYGEPLRVWMNNLNLEEIIDFGDLHVFETATTYPCILRISNSSRSPSFYVVNVDTLDFNDLKNYVLNHRYVVGHDSLNKDGWSLVDSRANLIFKKLNSLGIPLREYIGGKSYYGIKTGLNDAFVIDDSTCNRLILSDPKSTELIKPFLVGKDIKRYEPPESSQHLILIPNGWSRRKYDSPDDAWAKFKQEYPSIADHLSSFIDLAQKRCDRGEFWWELRACDYYGKFEEPKIFWPEIAQSARFTFDSSMFYANNKTYFMPIGDFFLLGILNSSTIRMFIHSVCTDLQGDSFNFSAVFVEQTPIRRISFSTPAPERARLGAELQQLYADGKHAEILDRVDACLPKDEAGNFIADREKSDVVHDLLAFLAERMLEINKQKQQEIKGFLGWLEGYVGAKVEDLTPKTKLQGYYEHDYESFLAVLKKNRKKLAIDPARREPGEALKAEFDGSMGKLGPLLERIEKTDRLIDAIVYRLYGLTDEEIRIVEGRAD